MKPLDLTKPIQTRDGRPVKFLHKLDTEGVFVIVCIVNFGIRCKEIISSFKENGRYCMEESTPSAYDLINVPVKHVREYWVNLYPNDPIYSSRLHSSENEAISERVHACIACKKITVEFKEGEGL